MATATDNILLFYDEACTFNSLTLSTYLLTNLSPLAKVHHLFKLNYFF